MRIAGPLAAVITPLTGDHGLDEAALRRLLHHVVAGGGRGVLVLGSTGELAFLPQRTRHRVVAVAIEEVGDSHPVLAGVTGGSVSDLAEEARRYVDAGATIVATPPLYGPHHPVRTEAFFHALVDALGRSVVGYHIPQLTGAPIPPDVVGRLAAEGVLAGLKDSGRDLEYFQAVAQHAKGVDQFSLLTGSDTLIVPALGFGASGSITIGAGIAPAVLSDLYAAVAAGHAERANEIQRHLTQVTEALRIGHFPAGVKYAAELLGLSPSHPAPPNPALGEADRARLRERLHELRLLPSETEIGVASW